MTEIKDYLSDEELELLIANVEQNELVSAPPDLLEEILKRVPEDKKKQDTNLREFRNYCFKVCASVAAAVVLVIGLPIMRENAAVDTAKPEPYIKECRYATKEEALKDRGYMKEFDDTTIFGGNNGTGIFNHRMEDE